MLDEQAKPGRALQDRSIKNRIFRKFCVPERPSFDDLLALLSCTRPYVLQLSQKSSCQFSHLLAMLLTWICQTKSNQLTSDHHIHEPRSLIVLAPALTTQCTRIPSHSHHNPCLSLFTLRQAQSFLRDSPHLCINDCKSSGRWRSKQMVMSF